MTSYSPVNMAWNHLCSKQWSEAISVINEPMSHPNTLTSGHTRSALTAGYECHLHLLTVSHCMDHSIFKGMLMYVFMNSMLIFWGENVWVLRNYTFKWMASIYEFEMDWTRIGLMKVPRAMPVSQQSGVTICPRQRWQATYQPIQRKAPWNWWIF